MEIKFIKDHLTSSNGDVLSVTEELGNYLIRCKAAVANTKAKEKPVIETEKKPSAKKKK